MIGTIVYASQGKAETKAIIISPLGPAITFIAICGDEFLQRSWVR